VRFQVPQIDAGQLAAYVFTSGSSGTPVPHAKTWGRLVQCVRAEMTRLAPIDPAQCAILGTVPAQHMYGFESTVLLPLQSGAALCAERPFFPADIAAALSALPRPRVLISTPVHLRALLTAELALPALELIVSATAMLPANLAREVESRYGAPLLEIYGSTETGQMASRRTALEDQWRLWPGVRLTLGDGQCSAQGGHVERTTALSDVLEPIGDERFVLHGRTADLVNIAGKRSSLAYLNHQLNAIPGVLDGAFFVRDDSQASLAGVARLAALVVAPSLDVATIVQRLRERIDPVFLPRPLLRVQALPRNETGKLPQHTLRTLVAQAAERAPHLFA
jgi:acyl-coenzyme A synthetase/AMP-(fatty) acid ligase